jgi:hypothetical protein
MNNSRPTTPTNQPTKPASTNAPERPVKQTIDTTKLSIQTPKVEHTCQGCVEEQFNQMAHVGPGGCLEDALNMKYTIDPHTDYDNKEDTDPKEETKEANEDNSDIDNTYKCPCYVDGCGGDCGTLWCGCIDVCRGRCGLKDSW